MLHIRIARSLSLLSLLALVQCGGDDGGSDPAGAVQPAVEAKKKKVLIFGLDGVRPDALAKAETPNFDALRADGVYGDRGVATDTTWSGSGWSTLLHGVWRDKHGVKDNTFSGENYGPYPDLFTRLEQIQPSLSTVRLTSWTKMQASMTTGADQAILTAGDEDTEAKAVAQMGDPALDAIFVYFMDVDSTGHAYGFHPSIPQYVAAIESVDAKMGTVLAAMKGRPTYADEDWLVLAVTDHGGALDGHGKDRPEDRTVFFLAAGPSVPDKGGAIYPDPTQVDLAPTVFAHLGIAVDPAWKWDGRAIGLSGVESVPPVAYGTNLVLNGNGEFDRGFGAMTPNGWPKQWMDVGEATVMAYGSAGGPAAGSPGPADRGKNYLAGGVSTRSSLVRRIDVSSLSADIDASIVNYSVSAFLGGFASEKDTATLTVRFVNGTRRAAASAPNGKVYFFSGDQYCRYDPAGGAVDAGYPKPVAGNFPGLETLAGGAKDIDAAVNWGNGKLYFFKGAQYVRYDWAAGKADAGYPKSIATYWPGLDRFAGGAKDIDSIVEWGNGKVYFFKGDEYIRYDRGLDMADAGYPRRISQWAWDDLSVWPAGIDAAVEWPSDSNRVYFFKQGSYIRWSKDADAPYDATYPRTVDATTWSGLTAWYQGASTVVLGPVTAAERANVTGLVERTATGIVPAGTRVIDVEVLFRREYGTNNDATADNVSLILTK